jgi:hypothetical protein
MNRFQKVVLAGAALGILVLFLFPPYDLMSVGRGRMFDAFYPMFSVPPNRAVNGDVLYLFTFAVLINAALAWLLLSGSRAAPGVPRVEPQAVVVVFAIVNLAVALLFPPMEAFPFAQRITVGTFDGFYFAFGDKARRSIFVPLLYMEVLFALTNAFAFWLAMSVARRAVPADAGTAPARTGAETATAAPRRGPERRKRHDPAYKGPERRNKSERRRPEKR